MSRRRDTRVSLPVIGLDLSLRGAAGVCLPAGWRPGRDWPEDALTMRVGYEVKGGDPEKSAARIFDIAEAAVNFFDRAKKLCGGMTHVYVEDYAFGATHRGMALAETCGAVKALFYRKGIIVVPVGQHTVRRFFLNGRKVLKGKGGMATALAAAFGSLPAPCPWEDSDRRDAFLVANWARTELGMPGLLAPPE